MTDQMDVDVPSSNSGGSISTSSSAPQQLDLTGIDLPALNGCMETRCDDGFWQDRARHPDERLMLVYDVLFRLLQALEDTDMKDYFIASSDTRLVVCRARPRALGTGLPGPISLSLAGPLLRAHGGSRLGSRS